MHTPSIIQLPLLLVVSTCQTLVVPS